MSTLTVKFAPPRELTRDDLVAATLAEDVSFHLYGGHSCTGSFIRLYTRGRGTPIVYTARQQRLFADDTVFHDMRIREIPVRSSAHGYGSNTSTGWQWSTTGGWTVGADATGSPPSCFFSMYQREVWATIARSLKVGDTLAVEWVADNNSETIRTAGLHMDEVYLHARPKDTRKHARVYRIGTQVGPDNSARMVRRFG